MTNPSRSRGFLSLDALFCALPLAMLCVLLLQTGSEIASKADSHIRGQQAFDKLVSAADHTVKVGAAVKKGGVRYPNWIDRAALGEEYASSLRERAGLSELYLSLDEPEGEYAFCIYRLVVVGPEKALAKLYVCGG